MQRIVFDGWTLIPASGELSRGGVPVRLQEQVLQVLLALLERPGQVVTREELIARLWPQVVVDYDTSLKSIVRKLRLALGDAAEEPRYIETLPRKGYRFIGVIAADTATPSPAVSASAVSPRHARSWRWSAMAVAAVLCVAALAVAALGPWSRPVRLGVMPFDNLSSDEANAFFADGLHEEVLTALSSSAAELEVVPRTTMMSYRAHPRPIAAIATELDLTHVLEASVRREGDDVRVTVRLIDARGGGLLWSQSYDRKLRNAMTLQADVANSVAAQLAVKLSNRGGGLPPSTHPEAHDLYRRALVVMQRLDQRTPAEQLRRAEEWLDRAIELDDVFAAAYARRAQLKLSKYVLNHDVSEENRAEAWRDLERARQLAGDAVAVVQARSRYSALFDTGPDEAIEILDTLELASSREPEVLLWRAFFLCRAGRSEEGLATYARAAELDPRNATIVGMWERELWALRRPLEALAVIQAFNEQHTGGFRFGDLEFAFTGRTESLRDDLEVVGPTMASDNRLVAFFDLLRFEGRFAELGHLVAQFQADGVRVGGFREYGLPGTGTKPVAELRGWVHLLTENTAAAAEDGRIVLAFVEGRAKTPHNAWHLGMLEAEGWLFRGDHAQAVAATRAALAATPPLFDFVTLYSRLLAARIYAWAGAHDEAVDLLETLATQSPSLGPAEITRDPFFATPLGANPRYQALAAKLETHIARHQGAFSAQLRDTP